MKVAHSYSLFWGPDDTCNLINKSKNYSLIRPLHKSSNVVT